MAAELHTCTCDHTGLIPGCSLPFEDRCRYEAALAAPLSVPAVKEATMAAARVNPGEHESAFSSSYWTAVVEAVRESLLEHARRT